MKDGSYRVYLTLTLPNSPDRPYEWRVAPIIVQEGGHLAVDDVIYLDDSVWDNEAYRRNMLLSQYLSAGCNGPRWIGPSMPSQPEPLARSLYAQVLARRPGGIPVGEDWKVFAPYMSASLLHKIDLALACEADWDRKYAHSKLILKPPFGTLEMGLFSGGDEETEPRTFRIERIEPQKDGSVRVYVELSRPEDKWTWHVVDILTQNNGRYVLDDVIYLKERPDDTDYRLSHALSYGCRGPRWVGGD